MLSRKQFWNFCLQIFQHVQLLKMQLYFVHRILTLGSYAFKPVAEVIKILVRKASFVILENKRYS